MTIMHRFIKGGTELQNQKHINSAKEALKEYRWKLKQRDMLVMEMDESYYRATSCTVRLRPDKTSGGNASYDRMADDVVNIADSRQRLKEKIAELDEKLASILAMIDAVRDERGRLVLTMRYVRGMRWEEIQKEMSYSEKQVKRIHGFALLDINRKFFKKKTPNDPK